MPANLENSTVATGLEKVNFHSSSKEGQCQRMFKQLGSFHIQVRLCSKSFKLGLSITWTKNFQMYKLRLEKAEKPEIKLPMFIGSWRKQGNSRKTSACASLTTLKPLTLWITTNCGKLWKMWDYRAPYLSPQKPVCRSKITVDGDCSHEIKRCLLFGRKAMANLDSILKSRDITLIHGLQNRCCLSRHENINPISTRALGWPAALSMSSNILKGIFFFFPPKQ